MLIKAKRPGFTIIELVLVLSLMAIFFGLSTLYYQTTQVRADLTAQTGNFVGFLRLAQSSAEAGKGGTSHGIHLEDNGYAVFAGSAYDANDDANYDVVFPDTIEISAHSLNGGDDDIIFTAPNGETDEYGTVTFFSSQINQTKIITITNAGAIIY